MAAQPISAVEWIAADRLCANDYNPNVQPPPERRLLKISLLEDGWTQPVVVVDDGAGVGLLPIVDGEHRWRLALEDPAVRALTAGAVPIVRIRKDRAHLMLATIRHNRARGEHGVLPMATIVRELLERQAMSEDDVAFLLQMEPEEIHRLADRAGMPDRIARSGRPFSKGWVPG